MTFQAGYQASRKAGTGCRSVGPIADLFLLKNQLITGLCTDAINSSNAPAYRSYGLIFIRHALQNMGVAVLTYTPRLTSLNLNSNKVLSLNMSNNEALLHIELNRILNIAQAFTDATRALIADMCTKGNNPYGKRPVGPTKRSIILHGRHPAPLPTSPCTTPFPYGGAYCHPPPPAYVLQESMNAQDTLTSSSPKR